jgi:hypothetical protein
MSSNTQLQERRGLSVKEASRRGGWSRATGKLRSAKVLGRRIITVQAVDDVLTEGAK